MTDAVIAQTAGDGVDPRKPPVPEAGAQHLLALDGTELVIIAKKNDHGTYYATTALVGAIGGTGGGGSSDLTVSSNNGATTVGPKEGDDVLQLVQDIVFGGFLIYREDGEGHIANVEAITGYILGLNTQDRPSDPTADVAISSGNAGGGDSGNVRITVGTASGNRGALLLDVNNIGCSNDGFVVNASAGPIAFFGSAALTPTSNGADVSFTPGPGGSSSGNGGNIHLSGGPATAGDRGLIILDNLPTADPHVAGALWLNSGAPAISAGS